MIQRSDNTVELYLDEPMDIVGLCLTASAETIISDVSVITDTSTSGEAPVSLIDWVAGVRYPVIINGRVEWLLVQDVTVQGLIILCDRPDAITDVELVRMAYEEKKNKISQWQSTPDDEHYPSERLVRTNLDAEAQQRIIAVEQLYREITNEARQRTIELNVHKASGDHDSRYLLRTENDINRWYWLQQLTPPQLSQFSWVNQRNVTTRIANGAVVMYAPAPGSAGDKWSLLITPLQSQVFDAVVGFTTLYIRTFQQVGIALVDNNIGKLITLPLRDDMLLEVDRRNSVSVLDSVLWSTTISLLCTIVYLRIVQTNNSRRVFYISYNGVDWIELYNTTSTDWIIPTHIGFGINPYKSSYAQCATFVHWQVNY